MKLNKTLVIAEIGQNHDGDIEKAKSLIDMCSIPIYHDRQKLRGVDVVKFCKRELSEEMSDDMLKREYNNPNSYGATYGEHRRALELSYEEHFELYKYTHSKKLLFADTICSPLCFDKLTNLFEPDIYKVASRDILNKQLLERLALVSKPVIISTGMSDLREILYAVDILSWTGKLGILHCQSEYPTAYNHLNLQSIEYLKRYFPDCEIGLSDHTDGIWAGAAAVQYGAKIIEKHITLDRKGKGTDHLGSLDPAGLIHYIRDIRNAEMARGFSFKSPLASVSKNREKLFRSLHLNRDKGEGEEVTEADLIYISPGNGMQWQEFEELESKRLRCAVRAGEMIRREYFE